MAIWILSSYAVKILLKAGEAATLCPEVLQHSSWDNSCEQGEDPKSE